LSGSCFLCRLRSPVVSFPMWTARPPRSAMRRSDSSWPIRWPSFVGAPYLRGRPWGLPGSSASLFLRARLSDPSRPSGISPMRSLCVGFRYRNTVAACSNANEAELLWGVRSPLRPTGFSVYASHAFIGIQGVAQSPHQERVASIYLTSSVACATLDMGGWLGLAQRGLTPRKRRRALPGALRSRIIRDCGHTDRPHRGDSR